MKKIYQSEKFKRYSKKKVERNLRKRRRHKKKRKNKPERIRRRKSKKPKKQITRLHAPVKFSLKNNIDEVLLFFASLTRALEKKDTIFVDLSGIKEISSGAILYLLSILDKFKQKGYMNVSGNAPNDQKCRALFNQSGFYEYVSDRKGGGSTTNPDILSIRRGSLVNGKIVKQVIDFSAKHLRIKKSLITKSIYATLIECMANTRDHAYSDKYDAGSEWWVIALYNKNDNRVNFTILDNGMGIPRTVKKKIYERFTSKDYKLIISAMKGDFRTQTKKPWHGKGLPRIDSYFQNKRIDNLVIISNRGYINYENSDIRNLDGPFHGTLLSWDIVSGTQ